MTENKKRLQICAAGAILLLMVGTFLSFFIAPVIEDARVREALGDPNATVTDTARSPWIYTGEQSVFYLYLDKIPFADTIVVPEITNGYPNKSFSYVEQPVLHVKTLVLPKTVTFWAVKKGFCTDWIALERVVFSDGIKEIPAMPFRNVPALREIYFPASLTRAPNMTVPEEIAAQLTVHYAGTEEQWYALGNYAKAIAETYTMCYESTYQK